MAEGGEEKRAIQEWAQNIGVEREDDVRGKE
jgi:hypothetical protein